DQRGVPVSGPPYRVSCTGIWPLLSLTQISLLPDRFERKATRLPSGEYCGLESYCVEEITLVGGCLASGSIRQILASWKNCAYAIRPSRAKIGSAAFSATPGKRSGSPPETRIRQRTIFRRRSEEKTTERPSAVQATERTLRLSKVTRCGAPPFTGVTYTSSTPL